MRILRFLAGAVLVAWMAAVLAVAEPLGQRIDLPPAGRLYHGVYPGGQTGEEDDITPADVLSYESVVGKQAAWVYFSHNWYRGRKFPAARSERIRGLGAVPFIRLMLRSSAEEYRPERVFTTEAILRGKFDQDLRVWARDAKAFGTALLVEYGTECNGDWFPWNGRWNGGSGKSGFGDRRKSDGPERFVAAYRHIVEIMRAEGADNITWVFHANWSDSPDKAWNRFENYYPGDDVVDWVGVSGYGAQTPMEDWDPVSFRDEMDAAYPRLAAMAPSKPVVVLEFGCTARNSRVQPEVWAQAALDDLFADRWPRVAGFSWWNERWENDDNPRHDTTMRVQDIPALARVFRDTLADFADQVQRRPAYAPPGP